MWLYGVIEASPLFEAFSMTSKHSDFRLNFMTKSSAVSAVFDTVAFKHMKQKIASILALFLSSISSKMLRWDIFCQQPKQPHIVLIMADDLGWNEVVLHIT